MFYYSANIYLTLTNIKSNTSIIENHLKSYKKINILNIIYLNKSGLIDETYEYKFPSSDTNKKPDKYFLTY